MLMWVCGCVCVCVCVCVCERERERERECTRVLFFMVIPLYHKLYIYTGEKIIDNDFYNVVRSDSCQPIHTCVLFLR